MWPLSSSSSGGELLGTGGGELLGDGRGEGSSVDTGSTVTSGCLVMGASDLVGPLSSGEGGILGRLTELESEDCVVVTEEFYSNKTNCITALRGETTCKDFRREV